MTADHHQWHIKSTENNLNKQSLDLETANTPEKTIHDNWITNKKSKGSLDTHQSGKYNFHVFVGVLLCL